MNSPNIDIKDKTKDGLIDLVMRIQKRALTVTTEDVCENLEEYEKRITHPLFVTYIWLIFVILPTAILVTALLGIFPGK